MWKPENRWNFAIEIRENVCFQISPKNCGKMELGQYSALADYVVDANEALSFRYRVFVWGSCQDASFETYPIFEG